MSQLLKRISVLAAVLITIAATNGSAHAQNGPAFVESMRVAQSGIRENTRQILKDEMMLTEDEAEAFWTLYAEYDQAKLALEERYINIVAEYMDRYLRGALTDDDADRLLAEALEQQMDVLQLRQRYLRLFRKVISGIKTVRLYQLENKLKAEVDAAMAVAVPLADPR